MITLLIFFSVCIKFNCRLFRIVLPGYNVFTFQVRGNEMRNKLCLFLCCFIVFLMFINVTVPADSTWQPASTVVYMIGILEWKDSELATYDKVNRQDDRLFSILKNRGVLSKNICFLKDSQATLDKCLSKLTEAAEKGDKDSTFFFYYAGHGTLDRKSKDAYFLNYDCNTEQTEKTCLSLKKIGKIISQSFKGNRVILCADCCYSGNLSHVADLLYKTGKKACVFTSASASNYSTGRWTFTMSLCDALSGNPAVRPGDGNITVGDAAAYIYENMKHADFQLSHFSVTENFSDNFVVSSIKRDQALPEGSVIGKYKQALWDNKWYNVRILDENNDKVKIHYLGYEDTWDEWVSYVTLRDIPFSVYPENTKIKVEWDGQWYSATILKVKDVFHLISYTGYGDEWNEWVASNRIKTKM